MNKVLILGSNSFAGSCFVDYLLNKNLIVYGVSRSNEKKYININLIKILKTLNF